MLAKPPSAIYQSRMITRRNIVAFGAGLGFSIFGSSAGAQNASSSPNAIDQTGGKEPSPSDLAKLYRDRLKRLQEFEDRLLVRERRVGVQEKRIFRTPDGLVPTPVRISCTIRNQGSGWYIIDDRNHSPLNISRLVQHEDTLEVFYSFPAVKVHGVTVQPDDWFASKDMVLAGSSAGLESIVIHFGRVGVGPVKPNEVAAANGNFFITGDITCNLTADQIPA